MSVQQLQYKTEFSFLLWMYNLYAFGWLLILLLVLCPVALLCVFLDKRFGGNLFYAVCRQLAKLWLKLTAMKYEALHIDTATASSGSDSNSDLGQTCIYVANHRSYIDIIMMLASMDRPYRPLGKEEMGKIPLFGFFYRRLIITVDRHKAKSRSKSMVDLKRTLERGISVFIFPEGTFNESELPLKEFYKGAFQLALKQSVNIQPVIFVDSLQRMDSSNAFSMRPGICRAVFLEKVSINDYKADQLEDVKQDVYNKMYAALTTYNEAYGAIGRLLFLYKLNKKVAAFEFKKVIQ